MNLISTAIQHKISEDVVTDVVIYEHGGYSKPIAIISDYEATQFCMNLFHCLPQNCKDEIIRRIAK